jgi:hypothetical protein
MYAHKTIAEPNSCNVTTLSSCICNSISLLVGAAIGAKVIASPDFSTMQKATFTILALFVVPTAADLYTNDDVFTAEATDFNEVELHYGVTGSVMGVLNLEYLYNIQ